MTPADQSAQLAAHEDHAAIEARLTDLQRERQDSRDHRTPLVPPLRLVRCEGPHLARGLW